MKPGKVFKDCDDCPEMVIIPAGKFQMGGSESYTQPVHTVSFAQPFAMGRTEVTQGQWKAVMGTDPLNFRDCGDTCPMQTIFWKEAKEFVERLNAKTGKTYRLPSEAEWEYACRAGGKHAYCGNDNIDIVAWYGDWLASEPLKGGKGGNSSGSIKPTAGKLANAWGLHDMTGNVQEWLEDCWNADYKGAPADGTAWMTGDCMKRVLRGGTYYVNPQYLGATNRGASHPGYRGPDTGLRVAKTLP
jgi:formylglycine-generating enzyme required for sulfatase activity